MALGVLPMYKWALQPSEFIVIIGVVGDTSYPAGGYALPASLFTLNTFASTSDSQLQAPPPQPIGIWAFNSTTGAALGGSATVDGVTGNLRLFLPGGAEVTTGATAATFKVALIAFGH
jgi:hypothetical protein